MTETSPNVLLILAPNLRSDGIGAYGSPFAQTPHLDRLAAEGVCCRRAYASSSCNASGFASLMSGLPLSRHGVWDTSVAPPSEINLLPRRLEKLGYRTAFVGKAHAKGAYGFQHCEPLSIEYDEKPQTLRWQIKGEVETGAVGTVEPVVEMPRGAEMVRWDLALDRHPSVWTADRAIEHLTQTSSVQSFFLTVAFPDPSPPYLLPCEFESRIDPADVPLPPTYSTDVSDKPLPLRQIRNHPRIPENAVRAARAHFYTLVQLIDRQIGKILDVLEQQGLAQNTLVIFTSLVGTLLGEHGFWGNVMLHYEPLVRTPLLCRWPDILPAGHSARFVISHLDLAPTVLRMAAASKMESIDAKNVLPALRGESYAAPESVLIESIERPEGIRIKSVVTSDRKLNWYAGHTDGELYDYSLDPHESINLWPHFGYQEEKATLLIRLLNHLESLERRA